VAVESAGIRVMHSEILRRTGSAGRITRLRVAFDNDLASGLDPLQDRPYISGPIALADVQRLHTWDHTLFPSPSSASWPASASHSAVASVSGRFG